MLTSCMHSFIQCTSYVRVCVCECHVNIYLCNSSVLALIQCCRQVKLLYIIVQFTITFKLKFRKYPSIHTNYIISHSTILQYNHNISYGSYAEKKYLTRKTMISTGLPYLQFSMNSQGFSPARLTWPAYDGGRKRENSSARKHCIIVASTCRRYVEFGRYVN